MLNTKHCYLQWEEKYVTMQIPCLKLHTVTENLKEHRKDFSRTVIIKRHTEKSVFSINRGTEKHTTTTLPCNACTVII